MKRSTGSRQQGQNPGSGQAGVETRDRGRAGDHAGLVRRELVEPAVDCTALRPGQPAGQLDVRAVVAGLAREQRLVELDQLGIHTGVAGGERLGERAVQHLHAIAAAGLDERAAEQGVDRPRRLVAARRLHELGRVRAGRQSAELVAAPPDVADHLLEVLELFARQPGERHGELCELGVAEHQTDRGRGRLLLAVGVIDEQLVEAAERRAAPGRIGARMQVQHSRREASTGAFAVGIAPATLCVVRGRIALAILVLTTAGACIGRTGGRVEYVAPRREPPPLVVPGILSAHFSRDDERTPASADAIVLVFDRELDAASLTARAFMVVMRDGSRVRAREAVLAPASEDDENRTVTLWGDFGDPQHRPPTDAVIIEPVWDEDGGSLLGAATKIDAFDEGPRVIAALAMGPSPTRCPESGHVVRLYWSDELRGIATDDLARIELVFADGTVAPPAGLDDDASTGTDSVDDNVLDLCAGRAAEPRELRIAAAAFTDPSGHPNAAVRVAVTSPDAG